VSEEISHVAVLQVRLTGHIYAREMDDDTQQSYADAGFGQRATFGSRPVVVIVDMCNAYFQKGSPLDLNQPAVITAVEQLVGCARDADVPVIWTRVQYEPGAENGPWYAKLSVLRAFDRGNPLADWVPGLTPTPGEQVVTKQHASGFFGTDLGQLLRDMSADTVVIGGVSTSGCVRATATDASASGFVPIVVREAVGDRTPAVHESNLFDLGAKYADVIGLEHALSYLADPTGLRE